ncbi:MAG: HD domain-containing phosphohydrolase [Vulcanimicrobiota bacterium]
MNKLVIINGDLEGQEFELTSSFNSMGREEGVDIHIPNDPSISRRHAVIRKEFGKFILEDLGSTNGTFIVNSSGKDEEVVQSILSDGKVFRVGKTTLQFVSTLEEEKQDEEGFLEFIVDNPENHRIRTSLDPDEIYMENWITVPEDWKAVEELNHKIKVFYEIGINLNRIMDLDTLLDNVITQVFEMFPAQRGYILLFNEKTKELETRVVRYKENEDSPVSDKGDKNSKIEVSKTIINQVIKEKKAILSDDARIDERFGMPDSVFLHDIRATLYAPLMLDKIIIGLLCIDSFTSSHVFTENDLRLLSIIANQSAQAIENARLHQNLRRLFVSSIRALANAIEARDVYTRGHSERVTSYSVKIAERMNLTREEIENIRYAALLHDIGKINIQEHILNKPGKLDKEEFDFMKQHPVFGARILEPVEEFKKILPYVYHHHEKYDRSGYPGNLGGEEIPLPARILAVADSFDAMTSDRPYRKAMTLERALTELKDNMGTQFDPKVVSVFLDLINSEENWLNSILTNQHNEGECKKVLGREEKELAKSSRKDGPKTIVNNKEKEKSNIKFNSRIEKIRQHTSVDDKKYPITESKTIPMKDSDIELPDIPLDSGDDF